MKKIRADILLFERGLCESREKARVLILSGSARTGPDSVVKKPSDLLAPDTELFVDAPLPYVSRGAYKLLESLEKHAPNLTGLAALDVGASTGGFTDLMLQKGAAKVYAVDTGRGQLHAKLRADPRVVCMEKVNARHAAPDLLPEKVDVMTMDVSFISSTKILPAVNVFLKPGGLAFILVKPQFEAEVREVGKGGVVKDEAVIARCIEQVRRFAEENLGWDFVSLPQIPHHRPQGQHGTHADA